jgi:ParB family transcriptional regulator, chromosome partitioning protein
MDTTTAKFSIEQIEIELIHPNPDQPRKLFDEDALDELASSIQQHGLLQPLVVRPNPKGGGYMIIAGERRWRASQRAGLETLPCNVIKGISDADAFILSVTENVARRDMTIIEEANSYAEIRALGKTVEQIAALFGKGEATVQYRLDLLTLREDLQHLVARGQITAGPAWYLCQLSHAGQGEVLAKLLAGELKNDDELMRYANAVRMKESAPALFEDKPLDALTEAKRRVHKSKVETAWAKVEAMAPALSVFTEMDATELAFAIGQQTPLYHERLILLGKTVRRVENLLKAAKAVHDVKDDAAATKPAVEKGAA